MKTKSERKVDLFTSLESNEVAMKVEQIFDKAISDGYSFIQLHYEDYEDFNLLKSIVDTYKEYGYNIGIYTDKFTISIY